MCYTERVHTQISSKWIKDLNVMPGNLDKTLRRKQAVHSLTSLLAVSFQRPCLLRYTSQPPPTPYSTLSLPPESPHGSLPLVRLVPDHMLDSALVRSPLVFRQNHVQNPSSTQAT